MSLVHLGILLLLGAAWWLVRRHSRSNVMPKEESGRATWPRDPSDRHAEIFPCGCEFHAGQLFPCAQHRQE